MELLVALVIGVLTVLFLIRRKPSPPVSPERGPANPTASSALASSSRPVGRSGTGISLPDLERLLAEAAAASPATRIDYRDRIAPFGEPAIVALEPWLRDAKLASFAIRTITKAGTMGHRGLAILVLERHLSTVEPAIRLDVDDAIYELHNGTTRIAAQNAWRARQSRQNHCWRCQRELYSATHPTCRICRWLVCDACGACRDPRWGGMCPNE